METSGLSQLKRKRKTMAWTVRDEYNNENWVLPDLNAFDSDMIEEAKKVAPEFFEKYFIEI